MIRRGAGVRWERNYFAPPRRPWQVDPSGLQFHQHCNPRLPRLMALRTTPTLDRDRRRMKPVLAVPAGPAPLCPLRPCWPLLTFRTWLSLRARGNGQSGEKQNYKRNAVAGSPGPAGPAGPAGSTGLTGQVGPSGAPGSNGFHVVRQDTCEDNKCELACNARWGRPNAPFHRRQTRLRKVGR